MKIWAVSSCVATGLMLAPIAFSAPVIDSIGNVNIPAGKSLILPVTAASPNGRPLTFTATSSTNRITVEVHTNNPFWKMSVAQAAPSNAPGAFQTPFRGGVVAVTNIGDMTFMLFRDIAPRAVDAIQGLTAGGIYTSNTIFHRVVPGFVIQGGDPETNGMGGPVFRYDDEFNPKAIFSGNGQLALANSGKDTDGSQFFITSGPQRELDFGYTIFGQLLRGFNVLTNILNTPTNGAARPLADVIITRTSFVPDPFDTVLTLAATNLTGVTGTISVIADDGAGGHATNIFTATTVTNAQNDPPFLYPNTATNLVAPVNTRLTNYFSATDLDGDAYYWFPQFVDQASYNNASNTLYIVGADGRMKLVLVPNTNFVGAVSFYANVSSSSLWSYFPSYFPFDRQTYTFVFGDTAISAFGTNFVVDALAPFTNQLVARFTNGVPDSAATNFTAFINWGDNSTNSGLVVANSSWKEVLGSHTYTNAGDYPVYITIRSALGVTATVVSTASVPPTLGLTRTGSASQLRWPAWATEYQMETNPTLAEAGWETLSNIPVLDGYDNVITNSAGGGNLFFRLKK